MELTGEVILPSFTFFATGHSLLWNGLKPVLVDSNPGDFNIDPEQVERAITPRTTAILAVHIFGSPAQVEALEELARRHGLRLIFDGAHAFGSEVEGRSVVHSGAMPRSSVSVQPNPWWQGKVDSSLCRIRSWRENYGRLATMERAKLTTARSSDSTPE